MEQAPLSLEARRGIIRSRGARREALLAILLDLQNALPGRCIDEETAALVAEELGLPPARVYDTVTFYAMLRDKPQTARVVEVCRSAPCRFAHGGTAAELVKRVLGVGPGETTADGRFTVKAVPCFGACDRAPAVRLDERIYGPLDDASLRALLKGGEDA